MAIGGAGRRAKWLDLQGHTGLGIMEYPPYSIRRSHT